MRDALLSVRLPDHEAALASRAVGRQAEVLQRLLMALIAASSLVQLVGVAQAQALKPIQEPITGKEELGDLSQPRQALAQFYKAFNSRDLAMIDDNFAASDEVAIDNPLGGIRRGADVPHKMYEIVFKSPADVHVEFWDYTIQSRRRRVLGCRAGTRHVP